MKTILFIDDNEALQSVYKDAFERIGYHIIPAYSGVGGLKQLEDIIPDLVLLDIMMEPMDGWVVLEEIRKNQDSNVLPVIVMTAKSLHPREIISYGELINGYITKPLRLVDLRLLLEAFWNEQESIEKKITDARSRGVVENIINEYRTLKGQTQVIAKMLLYVENMLETSGNNGRRENDLDSELNTIRNMLTSKNKRFKILQQQVE
jgi:two-component system, OmpR family, response regulator